MTFQEFNDEHIITHKIVYERHNHTKTLGVGSINMCKRYVQEHDKLNLIIEEL